MSLDDPAAPPAPADVHEDTHAGRLPAGEADVHRLRCGEREIFLVGTAHVSQRSVELVREVIERERPDVVCIELDAGRYEALSQEKRFAEQDLREVMRKKQLATLMLNLILASYQRRLGLKLGVAPGSELLEAARAAHDHGIPIALCDREVRITLRRAWKSLGWWQRMQLLSELLASVIESPDVTEEDLARLREQDVVTEVMNELGRLMPDLKRVLIDERDAYLAHKILEAEGRRIVAVVGAGHVEGMKRRLENGERTDLAAIEEIPPDSFAWKLAGWSVPASIVAAIAWIAIRQGPEAAGENVAIWFLAHAIPTAIGGLFALGHPLAIAVGAFSSPFTALSPLIGAGHVAAFAQLWAAPPLVSDFATVGDDLAVAKRWWQSRLMRIFLVFVLTTLGSSLGTWVGGLGVLRNLVGGAGG